MMQIPDAINACFEAGGSIAVWTNVLAIWRDKGYAGGRIAPMMFFFLFGVWNLYYYPHLGQMLSFLGGISLSLANCSYISLMLKFGRKK